MSVSMLRDRGGVTGNKGMKGKREERRERRGEKERKMGWGWIPLAPVTSFSPTFHKFWRNLKIYCLIMAKIDSFPPPPNLS